MGELVCFRCQKPGHRSADCPNRTRGQAAHPPAEPSSPAIRNLGVPPRRSESEIADAHLWANKIRAEMPALFGHQTCGDPADVIDSPTRRALGLRPVHQCVLRQMAEDQIKEITA